MESQRANAARLLASHRGPAPLLLPNPGDRGSARLPARLGAARVSGGGARCFAGPGAVVQAATGLLEEGTFGCREPSAGGLEAARAAFVE